MGNANERRKEDVGAKNVREMMRDQGRASAVADVAAGWVVPAGEALDNARAFMLEGDSWSALYWLAYYNVVRGA